MQFVIAVILATAVQFIIGAVWYSFLFGKLWGRIHGFDKLPKVVQKKMMQEMGPWYAVQLLITIVTSIILAIFIIFLPHNWNIYVLAGFFWLGFVVPSQASSAIFGGTEPKWLVKKLAVQAGASLLCLEAAAIVIHVFV